MPVWEQIATDQFDPGHVVARQVSTPLFRLIISTAFVVDSRIGCLWVTDEEHDYHGLFYLFFFLQLKIRRDFILSKIVDTF